MIGPEKPIMALKRDILFKDKYFEGFLPASEFDFYSIILANAEFLDRDYVETAQEYKQPVVYFLITNPKGEYFVFRRAVDPTKYREARLRGKYSFAIGGHVRDKDIKHPKARNHIEGAILRELHEEGGLEDVNLNNLQLLGYINQDKGVGLYHFGLAFSLIVSEGQVLKPKDTSVTEYGFKSVEELKKILRDPSYEVEGWSKILFENVIKKL